MTSQALKYGQGIFIVCKLCLFSYQNPIPYFCVLFSWFFFNLYFHDIPVHKIQVFAKEQSLVPLSQNNIKQSLMAMAFLDLVNQGVHVNVEILIFLVCI